MTDPTVDVETPVVEDEDAPGKRRKRSLPKGRIVSEIPPSRKSSTWDLEYEWFKQNPGTIKEYLDVSQTTPSYLRQRYGLDAKGRNTNMETKRVDMYVTYRPELADEIKAKAAGKRRPRNAPETTEAPTEAPAEA